MPCAERHAASLISEFGDLGSVLAGDSARQRRAADGNQAIATALACFKETMLHVLRPRQSSRRWLPDLDTVHAYVRAKLAFGHVERFCVLYLDGGNRLLSDDLTSSGDIDRAEVHVRAILLRAIELGAASLILAHNHPGGSARPSAADIEITGRLRELGAALELNVIDHVIVTTEATFSFRRSGLLS